MTTVPHSTHATIRGLSCGVFSGTTQKIPLSPWQLHELAPWNDMCSFVGNPCSVAAFPQYTLPFASCTEWCELVFPRNQHQWQENISWEEYWPIHLHNAIQIQWLEMKPWKFQSEGTRQYLPSWCPYCQTNLAFVAWVVECLSLPKQWMDCFSNIRVRAAICEYLRSIVHSPYCLSNLIQRKGSGHLSFVQYCFNLGWDVLDFLF
jgi:hypothetical protein